MVSVGRLRAQSFCRYLPDNGWQPTMLTFDDRDLWHTDPALVDELPDDLAVERVRWIHPFDLPFRAVKAIRQRFANSQTAANERAGASASVAGRPSRTSRLVRAKSWLERHVLLPDEAITGVWPLVRRGIRLHRRNPFDAIVVTLPAYSPWLAAIAVKRACGIPLVVDYRDLWHNDVLRQWIGPVRRRAELAVERWALSTADAVTSVSSAYTEAIRAIDPSPGNRFYETIYSGFDARLLSALEEKPASNRDAREIDILCVGRLYKTRRADGLVRALGRLQSANRLPATGWRITFLGQVAADQRGRLDAIIQEYGLVKHVRFEEFVPRAEALQRQRDADALALILDTGSNVTGTVPGKVFEYLALGRRILAICPEGETEQLLRQAGHSLIARPNDDAGIENIVSEAFDQMLAGPEVGVPAAAGRLPYVAERQTASLAGLLDRVVERSASAAEPPRLILEGAAL
jgi:glycosyltransferase involved in cell wall biosynthesis